MVKEKIKGALRLREKSQFNKTATNPLKYDVKADKISQMVKSVIEAEFPMMKENMLLHDLVLCKLVSGE